MITGHNYYTNTKPSREAQYSCKYKNFFGSSQYFQDSIRKTEVPCSQNQDMGLNVEAKKGIRNTKYSLVIMSNFQYFNIGKLKDGHILE
jgi:hypothetical protein